MRRLEYLDIAHNNIRALPAWLPGLAGITVINLAWNRVREVPLELLLMPQLHVLNLTGNHLERLPVVPAGARSPLRVLHLARNVLVQCPDLRGFGQLHTLSMAGNDKLPAELLSSVSLSRADAAVRIEALSVHAAALQRALCFMLCWKHAAGNGSPLGRLPRDVARLLGRVIFERHRTLIGKEEAV